MGAVCLGAMGGGGSQGTRGFLSRSEWGRRKMKGERYVMDKEKKRKKERRKEGERERRKKETKGEGNIKKERERDIEEGKRERKKEKNKIVTRLQSLFINY